MSDNNLTFPACLLYWLLCSPLSVVANDIVTSTAILADNQEDTYQRCIAVVEENAEAALDMAMRWNGLGGGDPALHCKAVALSGLGEFEDAATQLEALAEASTITAPVRAGLYTQAARAWMEAANYERSLQFLGKAIAIKPKDTTLLMDRALSQAALSNYWAAIDDLNSVLDLEPGNTEALVLRGSAYRLLDFSDLASDDIERALAITPKHIDALLELGLLAQVKGLEDEARRAWIQVLELAPESATADAVRSHIQNMDLHRDP